MRKEVFYMLDSVLSNFNYNKTGKYWSKEINNTILIIQYQNSRFLNGFFLNLGVGFKDLLINNKAKINDCHLIARYDQVFKDFNPSEKEIMTVKEKEKFKINISKFLLPYMESLTSKDFLKDNYNKEIPSEIWWLQNIDEKVYLKFIKGDIKK